MVFSAPFFLRWSPGALPRLGLVYQLVHNTGKLTTAYSIKLLDLCKTRTHSNECKNIARAESTKLAKTPFNIKEDGFREPKFTLTNPRLLLDVFRFPSLEPNSSEVKVQIKNGSLNITYFVSHLFIMQRIARYLVLLLFLFGPVRLIFKFGVFI